MAMPVSAPRYTLADLERFPNDGYRYELPWRAPTLELEVEISLTEVFSGL